MQNSFFVSGFLYNPKTNKILLLQFMQKDGTNPLWSTLGGEGKDGENAQAVFQRIISKFLGLDINTKNIYPIYDYFNDEKNKMNFVFYAEVKRPQEFDTFQGNTFSWIDLEQVAKLSFVPHSKQDIIVGERVIKAKWRDEEAKKMATL